MLTQDIILSILPTKVGKVFIAYSGGIDSHVLLQLVSTIEHLKSKVVSIYINHGLQEESKQWELHCEKTSIALGVEFHCVDVNVENNARVSLEEAARNARYSAFKTFLNKGDVILLAQHREDQMETVLLQLFRGAGVRGLSGMPLLIDFGNGQMARPFLDVSKKEIIEYAKFHCLNWVDDPSNQQNNFDRNFLRNQVIPLVKQRWPAIDKTVSRSAGHCANSDTLSQYVAKQWLDEICDKNDQTLMIASLLALDVSQQCLVVRQWFEFMGLRMPSAGKVDKILHEIVQARSGANPELNGKGYVIRRYRNKLYCLKSKKGGLKILDTYWPRGVKNIGFQAGYGLSLIDTLGGISKTRWNASEIRIKPRAGAEKIKPVGRHCHHSLKKLFQEKGIPPWERDNTPLIYIDDQLAAVSDLWVSADCCSGDGEIGYQIVLQRCDKIE